MHHAPASLRQLSISDIHATAMDQLQLPPTLTELDIVVYCLSKTDVETSVAEVRNQLCTPPAFAQRQLLAPCCFE